jgi:hypothetical protein
MKTLIGKSGYLFLMNDESKELDIHCNNLCTVNDLNLHRYTFKNYLLFVYPDKSYLFSKYLPDNYIATYRPSFDIYKQKFNERCIDLLDCLHGDVYYKTDTHINFKGSSFVYKLFIETVNNLFQLNLKLKHLNIESKIGELSHLNLGVGDLIWFGNLGNQVIDETTDTFYFDSNYSFYYKYVIINGPIRFLDYSLNDKTLSLQNNVVNWDIISNSIIYIYNKGPKILIFYDSFLLQSISLYFDLFEVYFVKSVYDNVLINKINPDYVFEFRIERFLM